MASRLQVGVLWRSSGVTARLANTHPLSQSHRTVLGSTSSHARCFSSQGTVPLRNASASSEASTSIETLATQSSETSASIIQPLVPFIEQLPELLHLPPSAHSYAISIVILTVFLRSCITLPVTLWQRKRTRKMVEMVAPRWDKLKKTLPESVAKRCRRQKKSYEEYEKELTKELKLQLKVLTTKYNCNPTTTFAIPLLVHLPLFVSLSLLIRTSLMAAGSPLSTELIPWWTPPADLTAKFEASAKILADRGLEGDVLKKLTMAHGPTLSESDKTMFGPIAMGILTTANVELGQWLRRGMMSENEEEKRHIEKQEADLKRGKDPSKKVEVTLAPIRANVLGNILRAAAIGFVAISSQAPTGLVVYWLTSASYTLIQNSLFALLDRQRSMKLRESKKGEVDEDDD